MNNIITKLKSNLAQINQQLKDGLQLNLDDFGLEENPIGEFTSRFAGVHLSSAFQPIYNIQHSDLFGHEALLRPRLIATSEVATPDFAFGYAEASNNLIKLDRICRALHLLNYNLIFEDKGLLFLNVHPTLLIIVNQHGKVFERILHANSVPTDRVVIELKDFVTPKPDDSLIGYENKLASAIDNYHEHGYQIAIDNFGNHHSLISRLWKLNPDFIKLDKTLITNAENNVKLRSAIFGLVKIIQDIGVKPIITGIETQTQLDIAIQTGAELLQGYFFEKPASVKNLHSSEIIKRYAEVAKPQL